MVNGTRYGIRGTGVAGSRPEGPEMSVFDSSTWTQLRALLSGRRGAVAGLGIGSIVAGFAESGVLAALAQVAAALVNDSPRVDIGFGPVHIDGTLGVVLAIAFV